jgi:hypothetical protein
MGKSTEWLPTRTGVCRFVIKSSGGGGDAFRVRNYNITHDVFFSTDPVIANGSRIRWTGITRNGVTTTFAVPIVINLVGVVTFDSTGRIWKVSATTHEMMNLPGGAKG